MTKQLMNEILHLLHENSKITPATIATMLAVTESEVQQLITKLEQEQIIVRYSTVVNWDKVDNTRVTASIDVKVTPQREVGFDAIAERIYRFPEVKSLTLISGSHDFTVTVEGKSVKDIGRFVSEKLSTVEHVISTSTNFVLKNYKQDGIIFEDQEADTRLVITP